MFNALSKIGLDTERLTRKKLSQAQALNLLKKNFKGNLNDIYKQIGSFREGIKSLEIYTE
jgi:hypothetical protein